MLLIDAYKKEKFLYTCGNGGSAADADHIVGELMKSFLKKRPIPDPDREKLEQMIPGFSGEDKLQCGLRAVSLHSQTAYLTAFANDADLAWIYCWC